MREPRGRTTTDSGALLPAGAYSYKATATAGSSSLLWNLDTPPGGGVATRSWIDPVVDYDPYNNKPLKMRFNVPQPTALTIQLSPTHIPSTGNCDNPVEYCWIYRKYVESGVYDYYWAGADNTGTLRPDLKFFIQSFRDDLVPQNVVLVTGTRPTITAVSVQPPYFNPMSASQTASFSFTSYGAATPTVSISFLNTESHSVVRTMTVPSPVSGTAVSVVWDGRSDGGARVASGTYLVTATVVDSLSNSIRSQILSTVAY